MIPANCTDRLQPLDISVNKAAKEFLRRQFHDWYAKQICDHLEEETPVVPVDLKLSTVKPVGAKWMMNLYDYLQAKPEIIVPYSRESPPTPQRAPTPHFWLNFLYRVKVYSNERPPSRYSLVPCNRRWSALVRCSSVSEVRTSLQQVSISLCIRIYGVHVCCLACLC